MVLGMTWKILPQGFTDFYPSMIIFKQFPPDTGWIFKPWQTRENELKSSVIDRIRFIRYQKEIQCRRKDVISLS